MARWFRLFIASQMWVMLVALASHGLILHTAQGADSAIELVGVATLPGTTRDGTLDDGTFADGMPKSQLGGISAIEYLGGSFYWILSDRGPHDGDTDYRCRFHMIELSHHAEHRGAPLHVAILSSTYLTTESGTSLVGSTSAISEQDRPGLRFDPEGLRRSKGHTIWISDEYGPSIDEFDLRGKRLRSFPVPKHYAIARPSARPEDEGVWNQTGRQPNAGFEGLALTPDGDHLVTMVQRPLLQDSLPQGKDRDGVNCRVLEIHLPTGKTREFAYPIDFPKAGVSELLAINRYEFLALERDSAAGTKAKLKRVYHFDLRQQTEVSAWPTLPPKGLPDGHQPLKKTLFLDLLDPRFGLAGESLPAKMEGLTFGPTLPDGRRTLVVAVDNDFVSSEPITFYVFALPATFATSPERK